MSSGPGGKTEPLPADPHLPWLRFSCAVRLVSNWGRRSASSALATLAPADRGPVRFCGSRRASERNPSPASARTAPVWRTPRLPRPSCRADPCSPCRGESSNCELPRAGCRSSFCGSCCRPGTGVALPIPATARCPSRRIAGESASSSSRPSVNRRVSNPDDCRRIRRPRSAPSASARQARTKRRFRR